MNNKPKMSHFELYLEETATRNSFSSFYDLRLLTTSSVGSVGFSLTPLKDIPMDVCLQCSSATVTVGK